MQVRLPEQEEVKVRQAEPVFDLLKSIRQDALNDKDWDLYETAARAEKLARLEILGFKKDLTTNCCCALGELHHSRV